MISVPEDRRAEHGLNLFLLSLTVFFFGSILMYAIYVLLRIAGGTGALQPLDIPGSFALTTLMMLAISVLLQLALSAVRRESLIAFRRYVVSAFVLSLLFFSVQGTGISWMIQQQMTRSIAIKNLYGLTFVLVTLHALHVLGGVAGLTLLLFGLVKGAYDHERHFTVKGCTLYWHFLGGVWLIMLASFLLAAWASRGAPA